MERVSTLLEILVARSLPRKGLWWLAKVVSTLLEIQGRLYRKKHRGALLQPVSTLLKILVCGRLYA